MKLPKATFTVKHLAVAFSFVAVCVHVDVNVFASAQEEAAGLVKMCLFYPNASGHARSDPILNQECPSDHVHTFYGPQNIHPNTSYAQIRDTKPQHSSSPWAENQSLYWHPSIYRVAQVGGTTTYTRIDKLETSPYYRWNTRTPPETVAFPPDFRMIAYSNQDGANGGGENGQNLFVECCDFIGDDEEQCENFVGHPLVFPKRNCDFLGIAFAMPTCWDERKGVGLRDPFNHVTYTTDGTVGGNCPSGYNKRIPQVQLFIRIGPYRGLDYDYQLSDGSDAFHVDFMNGWKEGKLREIIENCPVTGTPDDDYNPPCDCAEQFLTEVSQPSQAVCDDDVKNYILNEETKQVTATLPRGTCQGTSLIPKSWDVDPPFTCSGGTSCQDSKLEFKNMEFMRVCDWVARNPTQRCNTFKRKSHCPVTCGATWYCTRNSQMRFALAENGNLRKCWWVKNNIEKRCRKKGMCNTCRAACAGFNGCTA